MAGPWTATPGQPADQVTLSGLYVVRLLRPSTSLFVRIFLETRYALVWLLAVAVAAEFSELFSCFQTPPPPLPPPPPTVRVRRAVVSYFSSFRV